MADGLFDGGNIDAFLADPMTRLAISLLSQPNRGPQGQRIGFGQQLGGALGAYQGMQAQDAQMALAKLRRQQAERAEKMEQEQMARQEAFRGRASEYVKEGRFDPRAALTIGVETGALDPMQAIQQARAMKRYVPVGGNMMFDTELEEYVQAPPQPVKLGQGQLYATPNEAGGYTPQIVNPRTFAPPRPTGQAGGGLGKPPSGYRWTAGGSLEAIPGGPAASREAAAQTKQAEGGTKLRESEAKAATYMSQMRAASQTYQDLQQQGIDPTSLATQISTQVAGTIANPLATPAGQQLKQAQEQWAEAYLRFKTGAATNQSEIARNVRTFFPQIGDAPEIVQQKLLARQQAERDISLAAGRGAGTPLPPAGQTPRTAQPNVPAILQQLSPRTGAQPDAGEAWIQRAMQANPSMSREQIIEEGRRRGKLR